MTYIDKLPDVYKKTSDSNNYKLLALAENAVAALKEQIDALYSATGIDTATGAALDMLGARLNQPRGSLDDQKYRLVLKAKIGCDMCDGTFNGVLRCIGAIFANGETSEITLSETACSVHIANLPLAAIASSGMTGEQAYHLIRRLLPSGVQVTANFDGTFAFSSADTVETDQASGFANDTGTTGGYFGTILADSVSTQLPI